MTSSVPAASTAPLPEPAAPPARLRSATSSLTMPSAETIVGSPLQSGSGSESKPAAAHAASADPEKQLVGPSPPASTTDGKADDAFLVEFEGPDDPYHPFNLPLWRRWAMVIIVSSASLCATCASSMGASTYAGLREEFGISQEVAILNVSLYVLGLAFGPLLLAPMSEFFGRSKVYYVSLSAFTLLHFPVAFANSYPLHLVFRFFSAFAGSAFLSVAGGTISDMFPPSTIGAPMQLYSLSPFLGPVLGPVSAGFINQHTSWRWTYYVVIIWAACQTLALFLLAPETHVPTVLKMKAAAKRRETGDERWMTRSEHNPPKMGPTLKKSVLTPFKLLRDEPMVLALDTWTAVLLAILYLDFNAIPIVFRQIHGFNQQCSGLAFLGLGVGIVAAGCHQPLWAKLYARDAAAHGGKAPPEARLRSGMAGAILVPLSLYLFAATSIARVHWIAPIICTIPFGVGIVFVFSSVFGFLADTYRPVAASAMASNAFLRCILSSGFPLFSNQMYARLGTVGAGCVLGAITTILAPLPFILFRYGPKLRERSKYT